MNRNTLETMAAWGDRANRDTGHLMDLVIAGTIDHLRGHGTARLHASRLEEIAGRIGPRQRDPDGAWVVTLLPPEDDLVAVNPYDVLAFVHDQYNSQVVLDPETEDLDIGALARAAAVPGVTLRDLGMQGFAYFVEWVGERYANPVDNQSG